MFNGQGVSNRLPSSHARHHVVFSFFAFFVFCKRSCVLMTPHKTRMTPTRSTSVNVHLKDLALPNRNSKNLRKGRAIGRNCLSTGLLCLCVAMLCTAIMIFLKFARDSPDTMNISGGRKMISIKESEPIGPKPVICRAGGLLCVRTWGARFAASLRTAWRS